MHAAGHIAIPTQATASDGELCARLATLIKKPAECIHLKNQAGSVFVLVVFFDSGIVNHPLREAGGHEGGKGVKPWYERDNRVLGIGRSMQEAAMALLHDRPLDLEARQVQLHDPLTGELHRTLILRERGSHYVWQIPELLHHLETKGI